jgi:hypothetical protein
MLKLQQMQTANYQQKALLARAPAIAQKLGIDPEVYTQMVQTDPTKAMELASKLVTPDNEYTKNAANQIVGIDKRTGRLSLNNGDTINAPKEEKAAEWAAKQADIEAHPEKYNLNPASPDFAAQKAALMTKAAVPGGQTINVGGQQTAMDKARNDMQAEDMGEYNNAASGLSNIAAFRDAIKQGGDDISTGPQGPAALKAKEALGGLFGVQLPGTSAAETMQLLGTQLATTASKEISNRPAAVEWQKILTVKPGIENSPEGTMAKLNLMEQQLQSKHDLAMLSSRYKGDDWVGEKDKYYAAHPFKSPFDPSQNLSKADTVRVSGAPTPGQNAIDLLKQNPSKAQDFDELYGRGAAANVLGKRP